MQAALAPVSVEEGGEPSPGHRPAKLAASPVLKWAGGKSQLLPRLEAYFPQPRSYLRYFEPFLGGGAVFFHFQPIKALLSDLNAELINVYVVIRDHVDELIASLLRHKNDADYYHYVRGLKPAQLSRVKRASRFLYLNKWCYNGLYRVNSKGEFNVPRGTYKNPPRIFDEANLRNVSRLLASAELRVASYEKVLATVGEGDFVYLDPPYAPLSATANFTRYTKDSFDAADQKRLAQALHELDRRGARFLLNNHNTPELRRLYDGFNIEITFAKRMINSRADRRGGVEELIVTNYLPHAGAS